MIHGDGKTKPPEFDGKLPRKDQIYHFSSQKEKIPEYSVGVREDRKQNARREGERLDDCEDGGEKMGRHEQVSEGMTPTAKGAATFSSWRIQNFKNLN